MKNIIKGSLISVATCAVLLSLQGCGSDRAGVSPDDPRVINSNSLDSRNVTPSDSDGDGLTNDFEKTAWKDRCGNVRGPTDPLKWSSYDNDSLNDKEEFENCTDPHLTDTDGDGLNDRDEVDVKMGFGKITDPTDPDTDDDGLSDGDERGNVANDKSSYETDPTNKDSDGDMLSDGVEAINASTNPNKFDTDGDGVSDGIEICGTRNHHKDNNGKIDQTDSGISINDIDNESDGSPDFYNDKLATLILPTNINSCNITADTKTDAQTKTNDSDGDGRPNDREQNAGTDPLHAGHEPGATANEADADIAAKYYYGWITQKEPGKSLIAKGFVYIPKDGSRDGYWMAKYEARYLNDDNTKDTVVFNYPDESNLVGNKITVSFNDTQSLINNTSPIIISDGSQKNIQLPILEQYVQIKNNKGNTVTKTVNGNNIECLEVKNKFNDDEVSSSYTGIVCELSTNYEYLSDGSKHDANNLGSTVNNSNDTAFRASASK